MLDVWQVTEGCGRSACRSVQVQRRRVRHGGRSAAHHPEASRRSRRACPRLGTRSSPLPQHWAGLALATLVGRDGTLGWQIARVAAVVVLTWAVLAFEAHLGDRGGGRVAVGVGVVAFAIGVGFMPYAVKDGLSVEASPGRSPRSPDSSLPQPERSSPPPVGGRSGGSASAPALSSSSWSRPSSSVRPSPRPTSPGRRSARRRPARAWATSRSR